MKKFFKRILLVSLVATMTSMLFAGCSKGSITKSTSTTKRFVDKNPKEYKGTITLWSWTDDPKYMIEQFKKVYPNVTVKFTQVGQDYQTKLKTVLQAGTGVPDLFVGELKNVKQWVDTDFWDNLSVAPYNAEDIAKNQMQYVADLGRDANKNLRALSWQATPGGFWYRRSLAKQYFGTDDPDKISKMMSTMDGLLDMGKKIYVQSGGKVSLLPNYQDLYWYVYANRKLPWVENDKLQIDQLCLDFFDTAKQARTEKLDAKLIAWQPAWFSASDNGSVFGYVLPTWGLQYVIKPSAPKTEGDWAISKGPASYFQGGTWMGLSSKSTNKELAWQFLKYVVANKAYVKNYVADKGDFTSNIPIMKEIANNYSDKFAGGQNTYKFFQEEATKINAKVITKYDDDINGMFLNAVGSYVDGKKSKDGAIAQFKKDVKNAYQDIEVK